MFLAHLTYAASMLFAVLVDNWLLFSVTNSCNLLSKERDLNAFLLSNG